ncbi:sn-glycerol-3-phosphate ABC transporter ATP-binding protein UgpC [Sphingomonas donggukensis]|uniref:Sn-glycerol-3-phosphate ABC transporter ATP-binding protein UgpC n=1 Tax=Sphingomonas donggukensis TaxID=2949093 RepID=A0ABY4TVF6_9SPHN|nr:sn-glycerol-3-phosphate ABC transporter ATP-binding protein UgpC [Sphingomonas donggukensis]URW75477.1 sn-glycerol-3-phosphate ABC transporter ATP-binding protein UgpC [Sphingomonas donggukensis]
MAIVSLSGAHKAFGATQVLDGIDLETRDGEFLVLVGPSGCGKSTLLRAIAGLEDLDAGTVAIDGVRVNDAGPSDRGIAMVFQSYALYPHMTVAENMGFALKLARVPRAEIDAAVRAAAETLGITDLLARKPAALSGGQRQRVAIGRAIVRKPRVFLFDEPLSNLDAALRVRMRYEFASLHKALATTMIYVTHDQAEAMTLADRIVVLNGGRVEQIGAPMELYDHPATQFVAGFIGSPRMNFLGGTLVGAGDGEAVVTLAGGAQLRVAADARSVTVGDAVMVGVRPEALAAGGGDNAIPATVRFVEALGGTTFAYLDHAGGGEPLVWQAPGGVQPAMGDTVTLTLPASGLHLFDADGRAFPRSNRAVARAA